MSFWLFFVQDFSCYNGYFLKFFVDINFLFILVLEIWWEKWANSI
jgi:hypothetical protein